VTLRVCAETRLRDQNSIDGGGVSIRGRARSVAELSPKVSSVAAVGSW
jgi:hypothetical protein